MIKLSPEFRAKVEITAGIRKFILGEKMKALDSRENFARVLKADTAIDNGCILIKQELPYRRP